MFHRLYQTPVVITRPFMTYGPRQGPHKLIPRTLRAIVAGQSPRVSSGLRRVDWVYVDDVVRGLLLAATKPGVEGGEFDLGSGTLVPVRAVIEKLLQLAGSSVAIEFAALSDRPFEVERRADTAATFARLGWKAQIPLEEGLTRTLAWFRAHDRGHSAGVAV
jgi:nucleoside-diphosphate-sugar epimerase